MDPAVASIVFSQACFGSGQAVAATGPAACECCAGPAARGCRPGPVRGALRGSGGRALRRGRRLGRRGPHGALRRAALGACLKALG